MTTAPEIRVVPAEPDDEMLRAALAVRWPSLFRDHLRHPDNGPDTARETEIQINEIRRQLQAALAAAPAPIVIQQWRTIGTADWYDGIPNTDDITGTYETRTLYSAPPTATTIHDEDPRIESIEQIANDVLEWLQKRDLYDPRDYQVDGPDVAELLTEHEEMISAPKPNARNAENILRRLIQKSKITYNNIDKIEGKYGVTAEAKHTQGPWFYQQAYDPDYGTGTRKMSHEVQDQHGNTVAVCQNEADARLISTTPELLDAIAKAKDHRHN